MRQPASAMSLTASAQRNEQAALPRQTMPSEREGLAGAPDVLAINYTVLVQFVFFVGGLCLFYLSGAFLSGEEWRLIMNTAGPAMLFVACLWTVASIVRCNSFTLWTPVPWFITSAGIFYGLGALAYTVGSEEMVASMNAVFFVNSETLWRTNLLNAVGIFVLTTAFLVGFRVADRRANRNTNDLTFPINHMRAEIAAYVFLGVGLPLEYLLILPYEFGQLGFVLPGVIVSLSSLASLGVFLLAYLYVKSGGHWRDFFWIIFSVEVIVELLRFNKEALLMLFVMAALGRYLASRKMTELVVGGAITFLVYVLVMPFATWGRNEIELEHGVYYRASFGERLAIVQRWVDLQVGGELDSNQDGGWWKRLSYNNTEALGMELYDRGEPGETFLLCVYGLVPRFVWPDKPVIDPGADFTEIAMGHRESHTGIGVFGEAYWNGGWALLLLTCCYIGVLFSWLTRVALIALVRSEWLLLPCAFMGIRLGFHIDDWFISYGSGMIIYLFYYFILNLFLGNTRLQMKNVCST
jgi:hypothetical protein